VNALHARSLVGVDWRYDRAMRRCTVLSSLLVLGCAARPADPEPSGSTSGTTLASEGSSAESSSEASSTTGGSESTTGDGDGDGDGEDCFPPVKLDLSPNPDPPLPDSCTVALVDWAEIDNYPGCMLCDDWQSGCIHQLYLACAQPGPGQTCADLCPSGNCAGFNWGMCMGELDGWGDEPVDWCGHYEIDGQCCTLGKILWVCGE
jgi:hypothetical protein